MFDLERPLGMRRRREHHRRERATRSSRLPSGRTTRAGSGSIARRGSAGWSWGPACSRQSSLSCGSSSALSARQRRCDAVGHQPPVRAGRIGERLRLAARVVGRRTSADPEQRQRSARTELSVALEDLFRRQLIGERRVVEEAKHEADDRSAQRQPRRSMTEEVADQPHREEERDARRHRQKHREVGPNDPSRATPRTRPPESRAA